MQINKIFRTLCICSEKSDYQRLECEIVILWMKSRLNLAALIILKSLEIIFASLVAILPSIAISAIPLTQSVAIDNNQLTSILGASIAIIEGIIHLLQLQRNWENYNSIYKKLNNEKYRYLQRLGNYAVEKDAKNILVAKVEDLILKDQPIFSTGDKTENNNKTNGNGSEGNDKNES